MTTKAQQARKGEAQDPVEEEAVPLSGSAVSRPAENPEERFDVWLRRSVPLAPGVVLDPRQAHRMTRSFAESLGAVVLRMEPTTDVEPV